MQEITAANFEAKVFIPGSFVLMFGSEHCPGCKHLEPLLTKWGREMSVPVGHVDIEEEQTLTERYEIQELPTTYFFVNGVPWNAIVGPPTAEQLDETWQAAVLKNSKHAAKR